MYPSSASPDLTPSAWDEVLGMLLRVDTVGRIQDANGAYLRFAGCTRAQMVGSSWLDALDAASHAALQANLQGRTDFTMRLLLHGATGAHVWSECVARWQPADAVYTVMLYGAVGSWPTFWPRT